MNQFHIDERSTKRKPQISDGRKVAFYVGTGLATFGLIMFASVFVTAILNFGNFDNFEGRAKSSAFRSFGGIVMIAVGQIIRLVGARGVAGSGVVLDPDRAREDLHPYTNAAGGMVRDVMDGAEIDLDNRANDQIIVIRCTQCRKLNEETDKFCGECGASLL